MSDDLAQLRSNFIDLEKLLKEYRDECTAANEELNRRLSRIMIAALGDPELGVVGFVELHREQHRHLLAKVDGVLDAQSESRQHRAVQASLPTEVAVLRTKVESLETTAREAKVTMTAYKRMMGWILVAVNGAWAAGVALWKFI